MAKYIIKSATKLHEIIQLTNEAIKQGYTPLGGVTYADGMYLQSMIRKHGSNN